jgi:hypothetical protein
MEDFIFKRQNSITKELCIEIINMFELEKINHNNGVILAGVNKEIKDTTDFVIPNNIHSKWKKIFDFLVIELNKCIREYDFILNKNYKYFILLNSKSWIDTFMIQKYEKNKGKYVYHHDYLETETEYRLLTFIWYLNDIEIGGETEFFNYLKIKPEAGKLIIFPANWTFPHCGSMPVSNNKYIITGWIYKSLKQN